MDVYGARRDVALLAPNGFEELIAAIGAAGMGEEEFQQVKFGGGEGNLVVAQEDATAGAIEAERPKVESAGFSVHFFPAEVRLNARDQLARAEGLGHVVVAADLQAEDAVDFVGAGCEKQYRRARQHCGLADLAAELEAIDIGQHDVQQDEIGLGEFEGLEGALRTAKHLRSEEHTSE